MSCPRSPWPLRLSPPALALALAAIPLALSGIPVLRAYGLAAASVFGSPAALGETLARAVPLTLTGLATSLALRISLYNLGAEGQLFAGALATLAVGTGVIVAPSFLMIPLVVIVGAAAGGAFMLLAALIKLRRGGDEAIVTLLLNVVMLLALQIALTGPLDIVTATVRSQPLIEQATLAGLGGIRLALGVVLALAAVGLVSAMLRYTVWGFDIRAIDRQSGCGAGGRHSRRPHDVAGRLDLGRPGGDSGRVRSRRQRISDAGYRRARICRDSGRRACRPLDASHHSRSAVGRGACSRAPGSLKAIGASKIPRRYSPLR